jgi:hypothetical protein
MPIRFEDLTEEQKKELWRTFGPKIEEEAKKKEEIPNFSEVYEPEPLFEGEQVEFSDVLNKEIILKDFKILPSSFHEGEFAVVQAELDGNIVTFPTSSKVLIGQLKGIKNKLPVKARIIKPEGKKYYTFK